MRHRKARNLLSKPADQRRALLRGLTTELFRHGRITTTEARAKAMCSWADKMLSLAKRGDLHARRQAEAFMTDTEVTRRLFTEIAPKYRERSGGYTQVIKTDARRGDNAPQAIVMLVE